jgi:16S rRNA U516 pseudouridylate synthase RsuA-like enzyme
LKKKKTESQQPILTSVFQFSLRDVHVVVVRVSAGPKRFVRRALAAVGRPVIALARLSVGELSLGNLSPGRAIIIK